MAQHLFILSLSVTCSATGAESDASDVPYPLVKLFNSGSVMQLFAHYDKNNDGTLSTAESSQFLQDVQQFAGVHLPARDVSKVKSGSPMTIEKFDHLYENLVNEIPKIQEQIRNEQEQKQEERRERQEELQNLFQSGDIEMIFAHYDRNRTGTLSSADQDQFLDDLQEMYGIHLPNKFRSQCKTGSPMTIEQFQMVFAKMHVEFQNLQRKAKEDQEKAQLKRELAGMSPEEQKTVAKMNGINLPDGSEHAKAGFFPAKQSSQPAYMQEEMLAYGARWSSGIYIYVAIFLVAAVASAVATTFVIRLYSKASSAPVRDSYLVLSA